MISFGTGGFRGVIGDDFTKQNIDKISKTLALEILNNNKKREVVVGYDRRFLSDITAKWIATTLGKNGIKVFLSNQASPTPTIMNVVKNKDCDFGVMVTASHNPYYFNGVKLFLKGGVDASVDFTSPFADACNSCDYFETQTYEEQIKLGNIVVCNFVDEYLDNINTFIDPRIKNNKSKILFNNLNGVGVIGLKKLFSDFNVKEYAIINEEHDAFFNGSEPNPTELQMSNVSDLVVAGNYDFALGTDSDADRLGIIDENGKYVDNNDILGTLYYYLIKYRGEKGDIVKNCATSNLIDKLASKFEFLCHEVDVGFKNISSKMLEVDALIGGESSGGLTLRNYIMGKDSVFSASLFLEMVVMMNKPVSKIIEEVHKFAGYNSTIVEREFDLRNKEEFKKMMFENNPTFNLEVERVDKFNQNAKYYFKNGGWALLRLSGTEPKIRVFVEMENNSDVFSTLNSIEEFIKGGQL